MFLVFGIRHKFGILGIVGTKFGMVPDTKFGSLGKKFGRLLGRFHIVLGKIFGTFLGTLQSSYNM
jgi:hypothetical protein